MHSFQVPVQVTLATNFAFLQKRIQAITCNREVAQQKSHLLARHILGRDGSSTNPRPGSLSNARDMHAVPRLIYTSVPQLNHSDVSILCFKLAGFRSKGLIGLLGGGSQ